MRIVAVLLVFLLAGCSDGGDGTTTSTTTGTGTTTVTTPTQTTPVPPPVERGPFDLASPHCEELLILITIPAERAGRLVPDNYTPLLEATGQATALAGLKNCHEMTIDGRPIGTASTSDVGILIESPDGSDGLHYYQIWWTSDNRNLSLRLAIEGWVAAMTPGDQLNHSTDVVLGEADFRVPSLQYGGSGEFLFGDLSPENHAVGWHRTIFGEATVTKTLTSRSFGTGQGTLTASEQSPLGLLIGGTEASGVALFSVYSMTGTVATGT